MGKGPLSGVRVIEFAGIGPGPFCGQLLSDAGADVVRIDRKAAASGAPHQVTKRGRRSVALDLKDERAAALCLDLFERADVVFEGFRPGVMERLGLGPDVALKRNPKLVYGRMTGWGQDGPLAKAAGHDINYIAISGALHAIGSAERPIPPLNLVGDFGGGALYLAFGIVSALLHARATGEGQVIDAAMSDGAASLMSFFYGLKAEGALSSQRSSNRLDGGAHFYNTYECKDGGWVAVGSFEPQFYSLLRSLTGLSDDPDFDAQMDQARWPRLQAKLNEVFKTKTRAQWCELMLGSDVCFAPVLSMDEAADFEHNRERATIVTVDGVVQPAPAPRFLGTPGEIQGGPPEVGAHNLSAPLDWGVAEKLLGSLREAGVL